MKLLNVPASEVEGHRLPEQGHDPVQQEQLRTQAHSAETTKKLNPRQHLYLKESKKNSAV
jgi:hypothetical protein